MKDKDKSAFPIYQADTLVTGEKFYKVRDTGMTLRDYFAAAALTGLIASGERWEPEYAVNDAYKVADAMLAAREETK